MACQACIAKWRKIADKVCKTKPNCWLCRKAQARLERLLSKQ
jgi:hypothetical protein